MPIFVNTSPTGPTGGVFLDLQTQTLADDFRAAVHRDNAKRFLNEAQRKIFRRVRVPEAERSLTVTTTAGQPTASLDADVIRLNSLRNTTDREPLTNVAVEELDDYSQSQGKPVVYAVVGRSLLFYPTPDAAYSLAIRYQGRPQQLVADADIPELHEDYYDLLVTFARAKLYRLEDDFEAEQAWLVDFERDLHQYAGDVQHDDRSRVRQVPGMFAGASAAPHFVRP